MSKNERRKVKQIVKSYIDWEYCTLREVIEDCNQMIEQYGETASIEVEEDGEWNSYSRRLILVIQRDENDEEMERRLKHQEQVNKFRLEQDRKKYEELKKQFES